MKKRGFTYEEIGERFNLTRQRVHQIYRKALSTAAAKVLDKDFTGVKLGRD